MSWWNREFTRGHISTESVVARGMIQAGVREVVFFFALFVRGWDIISVAIDSSSNRSGRECASAESLTSTTRTLAWWRGLVNTWFGEMTSKTNSGPKQLLGMEPWKIPGIFHGHHSRCSGASRAAVPRGHPRFVYAPLACPPSARSNHHHLLWINILKTSWWRTVWVHTVGISLVLDSLRLSLSISRTFASGFSSPPLMADCATSLHAFTLLFHSTANNPESHTPNCTAALFSLLFQPSWYLARWWWSVQNRPHSRCRRRRFAAAAAAAAAACDGAAMFDRTGTQEMGNIAIYLRVCFLPASASTWLIVLLHTVVPLFGARTDGPS